MGSAAMHAVLFGVAVYLVSMYGPGYGVSYEGFQSNPSPCPGGTKYIRKTQQCITSSTCPAGYGKDGSLCILSVEPIITCPDGSELEDGRCKSTASPLCSSNFNLTSDGSCSVPASCPAGYMLDSGLFGGTGTCVPIPDEPATVASSGVSSSTGNRVSAKKGTGIGPISKSL